MTGKRLEELDGPPALIVGGYGNAISIARSLARRGVLCRALCSPGWPIRRCRYVQPIVLEGDFWARATEFLLGPESDHLRGSVLFAQPADEGLSILIDHLPALKERFLIDRFNVEAQRKMLDKLATYDAAHEAGVPTPRYWVVRDDISGLVDELVFPLIVKPRISHLAYEVLDRKKFIRADSVEDVEAVLRRMRGGGLEAVLMEMIAGPDNALCSYYTYLDDDGNPLLDFTKRVIRRYPKNMGLGTYHITDHVENIKAPALRLFNQVGLVGLANVEFKLDPRDGELKLIECNARLTAATSLVTAAGVDLPEFVYRQVTGLPTRRIEGFKVGVRLWEPFRDYEACRELRRLGELTFFGWLRSVLHRQGFALWWWRDPGPSISNMLVTAPEILRRIRKRIWRAVRRRPPQP